MRRQHIFLLSLAFFALGILCQLYSMFSEAEPFMQQLSFMFVAMPGVLTIVNHYYHHHQDASEEKTASLATHARKYVLIPPVQPPVDADTSQHRPSVQP